MAETDVQHVLWVMASGAKDARPDGADESHHGRTETKPLISEEQKFWTALAEPPDLSYFKRILSDSVMLKDLLEDHERHFEERCLVYQFYDAHLQWMLVEDYLNHIVGRQEKAPDDRDMRTYGFYCELGLTLQEDHDEEREFTKHAKFSMTEWRHR